MFMTFMMAFMMPFMISVAYADGNKKAGGKDPVATKKEKQLVKTIKSEIKTAVDGLKKGMLKEEYVDKKVKELNGKLKKLKKATKSHGFEKELAKLTKDVQKQIDEVGIQITKLGKAGTQKTKTLKSVIEEVINSKEIKKYLEKGGTGTSPKVKLNLKAVTDVGGFTGEVITPDRRGPQVSFLGPKKFDIRMAIATGTSDVDNIDHIQESGFVNSSGFLAENAESVESTISLEQVKTVSERIATNINVSKKSLRNIAFLVSHITNRFTELIADKITDSALNGDGTGNTFTGFFNVAATFTAGGLAGKVDEANRADVLAAAIARFAQTTNLQATAIFISPLDEFLLTATKDLQGSYSENSVIVSRIDGRLHINGVPVWATFHVAVDKYLVADLSATTTELLEVEGVSMFIADQHKDNATKNQVTFIFEMDAILPIYKTFGFLKGDLVTDQALLETP